MTDYITTFAIDARVATLTDDVTGLPNRRAFSREFLEAILEAQHSHYPMSLIVADLDNFCEVSRQLGYSAASKLLGLIGAALGKEVAGYGKAFRYAGDKFAVIVPRVPPSPAVTLAKGLRAAIAIAAGENAVSSSVGIAAYPEHSSDAQMLWSFADYACRQAMDNDKIVVYDPSAMPLEQEVILGRIFPCKRYLAHGPAVDTVVEKMTSREQRQIAFLFGPTGIGKSRFLDEVGRRTAVRGARIVEAVGAKITVNRPFGMITRAVSRFLRKSPLTYHYLSDRLGEEHVALFVAPKVPVPEDRGEAVAMRGIITDLLRSLATDTPVTLLLDDSHYLDDDSADLIESILEDETLGNVGICATARSDLDETEYDVNNGKRVPAVWSKLEAVGGMFWTQIPPFDRSVVVEYVTELVPIVNPPGDFYDILHSNSDGTPLMLEEILKHLITTGMIRMGEGVWEVVNYDPDAVPSSPFLILEERVRGLSPSVRDVLSHAATIGREFTLYLLSRLSGRNEGHLIDLMDRARESHIIRESGIHEDDSFAFISELAYELFLERATGGIFEAEQPDVVAEEEPELEEVAHETEAETVISEADAPSIEAPVEQAAVVSTPEEEGFAIEITAPPEMRMISEKERQLEEAVETEPIAEPLEPAVEPTYEYVRDPKRETPLTSEEIPNVVLVIRLLKAALKNISLFEPTSRIITVSVGKLFSELRKLLDVNPRVVISEHDGDLVANARRYRGGMVDRTAGEELRGLLNDFNLRGLCFNAELDEGALRNALFSLAEGSGGGVPLEGWKDHFAMRGVKHINVLTSDPSIEREEEVPRAETGTRAHFEEVEAVVRGLVSDSEEVRKRSLHELEQHSDELLPSLARFIRMCPDDELRRVASFALWQASGQDPTAILDALRTAGTSQERIRIADALDIWQRPEVANALLALLDDPEHRVRTAAARSLEKLDPDLTASLILEELTPHDDQRSAALIAILRNASYSGLVTVAEEIITYRSKWDRADCSRTLREAALVLGRMGEGSHVSMLVDLGRRMHDERVRLACVWSLGALADPAAEDYLREEVASKTESVSKAAFRALDKIASG
jgi:diguanylate cyclase (GGDEF)-like protein